MEGSLNHHLLRPCYLPTTTTTTTKTITITTPTMLLRILSPTSQKHLKKMKHISITTAILLLFGLCLLLNLPAGVHLKKVGVAAHQSFDITKTNVKLLIPGKSGSLIHLASMTYSDSLPNVTFATFAFTGPGHTDLLTQTLAQVNGSTKVFIGARNYVHRLFAQEDDNDSNGGKRRLVLEESSTRIAFRNQSACPTVYADQVGLSPKPVDNDMKVLFAYPGHALFACGTDNCGRCETFKLHDFTARRPFFNAKVDNVADFIGGRKSAFVFEGHYKTANAYYVAVEPDGRRQDQTPPFFSARAIKKNEIIYTSSMSFYSSRISLHQQFSSTHPMRMLYGFEHHNYAYLLTVQPDSLHNDTALLETRLARICTNDHYFNSYMEIPLVCRVGDSGTGTTTTIHREALAAALSHDATEHFGKRLLYGEPAQGSAAASLYVSFKNDGGKTLQPESSPLCRFDMAAIEEAFRSTAVRCNTNGDDVELLATLHGTGAGSLNMCTRVERYNDSDISCGSVLDNGFILGRTPPPSTHIFTLINDVITSIGAATFTVKNRRKRASSGGQVVDTLLLGTQKGRLMKVGLRDFEYKMTKFFSQRDANLGPFMPNPSFDAQTGNFYFLTKRSVTEVPVVRCQVYSTCSACFRSKDEECFWNKGQCMFREEVKLQDRHVQCPPEVFNFQPREGPKEGGTVVSFYGFNFGIGEVLQNNKDTNFFKVTIGSKVCSLLERTNTFFTCRIEDRGDAKDSEGAITIFASDTNASNYHTLMYNIYGKITLENKFAFKTASLVGVHPNYGPYAGATRLTIAGTDLGIGSNVSVKIGNSYCPVVVRSRSYVICETPSLEQTGVNVTQSKQIEVSIDNHNMIINGDRTIPLYGSTLFHGDDASSSSSHPQMYKPKRKRTSYRDLDHPFSNISTFIELQAGQLGPLLFGESFQYRPNPLVTGISDRPEEERNTKTYDNFYTAASGRTVLTFDGDHLNSVHYPMLSLYFEGSRSGGGGHPNSDGNSKSQPQRNATSVPCSVVSARRITCLLPPLPRELMPIEVDRPVSASYVLHLDGQQLDSDHLPKVAPAQQVLKGTRILYYPDPQFTAIDDPLIVSTSSLLIELEGKYLIHDLPYQIFLNDSATKCIVTPEATSPSLLKCKLNMEQEMVDYLYGQEMELTVAIGDRVESIGIVKLQNDASLSTVGLVFVILASLLIVVVICAFVYYKTQQINSSNSKDNYNWTELVLKSKTLKDFFNEAYTNLDYYTQLEDMGKIIDPKDVQKSDTVLGVGNFGIVTRGKFRNECVAIKTLKRKSSAVPTLDPEMAPETPDADPTAYQDKILAGFFDEAITMKDFNHVNVLSLVGVTLVDNYPSILLPFMTYGDLATYVRNSMHSPSVRDLLDYAIQVARGMTYLASKNFVHRDLAARNCLIGQFNGEAVVKVADFGLSRKFEDKEYYRINGNKELPYRWMPPESLNGLNIVTSKSDVWSYGVLVWELTTRGQIPYGQLDFSGVLELLKNGQRLTRPEFCPDIIFSIMSLCWLADVNERPEFKDVLACMEEAFRMLHLQESNTYVNLSEPVPTNPVNNTVSSVNQFDYRRPDIQQQVQQYFDKSRSFLQFLTNQNPELYEDMELDMGDSGSAQYPTYAPPSYSAATAMPSESIVMTSAPTTSASSANGYLGPHETHFLPKSSGSGVISSPSTAPKAAVNGLMNGDYLHFSDASTLPR